MATVLLVDDDPAMRRLLRHYLAREYSIVEAETGEDAIRLPYECEFGMVLLNLDMPGIDGFETCRRLKSLPSHRVPPVSIVSSNSAATELKAALAAGADDYMIKPVDRYELLSRVRLHIRLRETMSSVERMKQSERSIRLAWRDSSKDVSAVQDIAVSMLAKLAETRDNETGAHLLRMRDYSVLLAQSLQRDSAYCRAINGDFLRQLYRSAPLHDIGKIGIPDSILLKPGRLTTDEMRVMQRHTIIGAEVLEKAAMNSPAGDFLSMATSIARSHHERWDGAGYPDGLCGEQIPLAARIVAVADVYDALTTERPYKQAWSPEAARQEILNQVGRHFDPIIVEAFRNCYEDFATTLDPLTLDSDERFALEKDDHMALAATA